MMNDVLRQKLETLTESFLDENAKLNLSALRTFDQCWNGNVLDSLAFLECLPQLRVGKKSPLKILDIGTGGGFPLLPLATALPDEELHGMDATAKKIESIKRIAEKTELKNITLHTGRMEELAHDPSLREKFDIVTARAVAPLATLLEYAVPFLSVGGFCVCWKSMHTADEERSALSAMKLLSVTPQDPFTYDLPEEWGTRRLLLYKKTAPTNKGYPRMTGSPKKTPL